MAKPTATVPNQSICEAKCSSQDKVITLHNWYLIKLEGYDSGSKLGVAGYTSEGQRDLKLFCSAPIVHRIDAFTLRTLDGVRILLNGIINGYHTCENGFPLEACSYFMTGFPYTWQVLADKYIGKDATAGSFLATFSGFPKQSKNLEDNKNQDQISEGNPMSQFHKVSSVALPDHVEVEENRNKSLPREVGSGYIVHCSGRESATEIELEEGRDGLFSSKTDNGHVEHDRDPEDKLLGQNSLPFVEKLKTHNNNTSTDSLVQADPDTIIVSPIDITIGAAKRGRRKRNATKLSRRLKAPKSSMGKNQTNGLRNKNAEEQSSDKSTCNVTKIGLEENRDNLPEELARGPSPIHTAVNRKLDFGPVMDQSDISTGLQQSNDKALGKMGRKSAEKRKADPSGHQPSPTAGTVGLSSEKKLKVSRSGRLLVPPLAHWCNEKIVYDIDRNNTGIISASDNESPRSSKQKSKLRLRSGLL